MSSTIPKPKSGDDPSVYQGGESSASPQDPNKSKPVNSEEYSNQTNKETEEDCEECSLRRFLKRGECKDLFIQVDNCVKDEDDDTKCQDARFKLKTCMYANVDYYGRYLAFEKAMLTQALKELEMAEEAAAVAVKKKEEKEEETKGK